MNLTLQGAASSFRDNNALAELLAARQQHAAAVLPLCCPYVTVDIVVQGAASPFRDNDGLAALLAVELQADLLVLLTDVDGLYTGPPTAESSL